MIPIYCFCSILAKAQVIEFIGVIFPKIRIASLFKNTDK